MEINANVQISVIKKSLLDDKIVVVFLQPVSAKKKVFEQKKTTMKFRFNLKKKCTKF